MIPMLTKGGLDEDTYKEFRAALWVVVIPQMLPRDLYAPLAAEHVPEPVACHHHELIFHHEMVNVNFRICDMAEMSATKVHGTLPSSNQTQPLMTSRA
jgi:hypothetical protein